MGHVAVFQHTPIEGTGHLGVLFGRYRVAHEVVRVYEDPGAVPTVTDGLTGVVLLGGPMGVNDGLEWIEREKTLVRAALERKIPVLGVCLGAQVIASALGARVYPNPVPEVGWFRVRQTEDPEAYRWFSGIAASFEIFHWHNDTFDLPQGASLVLTGEHCPHQAFVAGTAFAIQGHMEMTEAMVREWSRHTPPPAPTVQSAEEMLRGLHERVATLNDRAEHLVSRWIANL